MRERGGGRERERERESVCVCVCVHKREVRRRGGRERVREGGRERRRGEREGGIESSLLCAVT